MRVMKILAALALGLVLSACASTAKFSGPQNPKNGMSVIYVYRPWTFANGGNSPTIQLNGAGEGKLDNGSWLRFEVPSGNQKIAVAEKFDWKMARTWPGISTDIAAEPDKLYYVRFSTAGEIIPGYFTTIKFDFAFQQVPQDIALKELNPPKVGQ